MPNGLDMGLSRGLGYGSSINPLMMANPAMSLNTPLMTSPLLNTRSVHCTTCVNTPKNTSHISTKTL